MNLYIMDYGIKIHIKNNQLIIESETDKKAIPIGLIESLSINSSVQITSQAICTLSKEGIDISWFSGGKMICRTFGNENIFRQKIQFDALNKKRFILSMAKKNIIAKIQNQLEYIEKSNLFVITHAKRCADFEELSGVEGKYAALYFSELKKKIPEHYNFNGRNKHQPKDLVNAMLNYCYSLLYNKISELISAHGLNPSIGFMHSLKNGHYALSSDLMETLRCEICDNIVVDLLSEKKCENEFTMTKEGIFMSGNIRKMIIEMFHKKLKNEITTVNGFSNDYNGIIEQMICSYIKAIENSEENLFTPFRKADFYV